MDEYRVTFEVTLIEAGADDVEHWATAVLDHLYDLDGVVDPELSATLALGTVTLTFLVQAADLTAAAVQGVLHVQTALHARGDNTADLSRLVRQLQSSVAAADDPAFAGAA